MFETVFLALIISAVLLGLGSAAGTLILHAMFGADLPRGVQPLAESFNAVYRTAAGVIFSPFRFLQRDPLDSPSSSAAPPPPDQKQITKQ
jgi:hypothetical protein